jgi:eukaryotic-like serine/threonine-protein kinase
MSVVDEIVLPDDVVLEPVEALPSALRKQLKYEQGDYALTRPRSRTPSIIVDARTAGLLAQLRKPSTIVDAVIRYSRAEHLDPSETLESAFPVLRRILNAGLLLAADSQLARPIATTYARGDTVGALRIVEPVHVIIDTEVYLARAADRSLAALKVARPGAEGKLRVPLANEAAMLKRLGGKVSPQVIEWGEVDGRPYLAVSWCSGADAHEAAVEARRRGPDGRADLFSIAMGIADAYANLHGQGVLHGDVHPRNVLVDEHNRVKLIDFGLAVPIISEDTSGEAKRGCVDLFMEPELARAHLAEIPPPRVSAASEQYAVAALVYLVLTGAHTHDFVLEERQMKRQIADEPPRAFRERGVSELPYLERTLRRALDKDPALRFPTMRDFLRDLSEACAADQESLRNVRVSAPNRLREAPRLLGEVLERLAISGPLIGTRLEAPTSSVSHGAAGIAYAVLRIACGRGDEKLLALADVWSSKALRDVASSERDAFWNAALQITEETTGTRSFHHTASGVHCVDALIARARGDEISLRRALRAFVAVSAPPWSHLDVSFGRAGNLLGCALLLDASTTASFPEEKALRSLGDQLFSEVWRELDASAPIGEASALRSLGAAHGWAGILYAVLRWCESSGGSTPANLGERLEELAALATPVGRGLRWPSAVGNHSGSGLQASWCNGAAGFVHLWTLAHRLLGEQQYARMARGAAWAAFEAPQSNGDLCCGLAGRAYALLNLYRHGGDRVWLHRARDLAECAAVSSQASSLRRDSLYQGLVGVALLAADLECPEQSCMPLFEAEGWRA